MTNKRKRDQQKFINDFNNNEEENRLLSILYMIFGITSVLFDCFTSYGGNKNSELREVKELQKDIFRHLRMMTVKLMAMATLMSTFITESMCLISIIMHL